MMIAGLARASEKARTEGIHRAGQRFGLVVAHDIRERQQRLGAVDHVVSDLNAVGDRRVRLVGGRPRLEHLDTIGETPTRGHDLGNIRTIPADRVAKHTACTLCHTLMFPFIGACGANIRLSDIPSTLPYATRRPCVRLAQDVLGHCNLG